MSSFRVVAERSKTGTGGIRVTLTLSRRGRIWTRRESFKTNPSLAFKPGQPTEFRAEIQKLASRLKVTLVPL